MLNQMVVAYLVLRSAGAAELNTELDKRHCFLVFITTPTAALTLRVVIVAILLWLAGLLPRLLSLLLALGWGFVLTLRTFAFAFSLASPAALI
jgi:hypothetical protein